LSCAISNPPIAATKIRLYDNSKNIEGLVSFNYQYQMAGKFRYDTYNNSVDYYKCSPTQYLHYFITGRYWINEFAALQVDCVCSQNISGIKIELTSGPDENYNQVKNTLKSGALIGIDFIFIQLSAENKNQF
jgi:hypothetical protein